MARQVTPGAAVLRSLPAWRITDWSHNSWYHPLLLRSVPAGAQRVLDVGCGAGTLARKLAGSVPHVDGVDLSPVMIEAARRDAPSNVTFSVGDGQLTLSTHGAEASYDADRSARPVLHHLPAGRGAAPAWRGWPPGRRAGPSWASAVATSRPRRPAPRELPVDVAAATRPAPPTAA